jgi:putative flippase GtrA
MRSLTEMRIPLAMKKLFGEFSRFSITGASSALIQFSILIGLVEFFSIKPIVASTCGYLGGAFFNYLLNHYFTFRSKLPHRRALLRFSLNSLFGFCLNFSMMYFLLSFYPYVLCQILTAAAILSWNFFIHRHWTFRA